MDAIIDVSFNGAADMRIPVIAINDPRLVKNRGEIPERFALEPGVCFDDDLILTPAQTLQGMATLLLAPADLLELMRRVTFAIPAQVNDRNTDIPLIGQRCPTKARINGILSGWKDSKITPKHHSEIIHLFVYNSDIDQDGIHLGEGSLVCVGDGAGRLSSLLREPKAAADVQFNLSIDLYGELDRQLKVFLKYGRDQKKIAKGTNLGVESALIEIDGEGMKPSSIMDRNAPSYVVQELNDNYRGGDTWLSLVGWSTEAGKLFGGLKGNVTSISTALLSLRRELARSGIDIEDLPEAIDFGFRYFYSKCPKAVEDVKEAKGRKHHFHSTIACKVMLLMVARFYEEGSAADFDRLVRATLSHHYEARKEDYLNTKIKKMTPDLFFLNSKYFNSDQFNSGAVATSKLMQQLHFSCNETLSDWRR